MGGRNASDYYSASPNASRSVLILVGPTASGKTPTSLLIAKKLDAEIISADSRQVYKYMDIGTAKPMLSERQTVQHYFLDEIAPDESFNAGAFGKKGREIIDDILRRGKSPLVVGGSGLYVQALVDGFFEGPSADPEIRERLHRRLHDEGADKLLAELRRLDPASAAKMLPSNTRRIVRALEVSLVTGRPISELQQSRVEINFKSVFAGLRWDRQELYRRIDRRVDCMMEQGLVEEIKKLLQRGYSKELNSLRTTGYMEVFDFLEGTISYDRMVELIKQNSRRFAKRQLTWFRHDPRIRWFDVQEEEDFPDVAVKICEYFCSRGGRI